MTRVLLLAALVWVTPALAQQRDVRPTPAPAAVAPAPTGTASLAGTVVADGTGTPLGHATVALIGTRTGVLKVTSTNRDGQFSFTALPADRYTVGASKLPYLGGVAGARRPARPGSPVVVADGAAVRDLTIRLPLGAAISGTVYDEKGTPVPTTAVSVQQRRTQNGERLLVNVPGGNVVADDRGHYRVHGLVPGEYVVSVVAMHRTAPWVRVLTDSEVDEALAGRPLATVEMASAPGSLAQSPLAPVFYPGTTRIADAGGVLLAAGEERQNIDVRLESALPSRIEGVVSTADGSPLPQVSVIMTTAAGSSPMSLGATVRPAADGRFSIQPQPPGTYILTARAAGARPLVAVATVEAGGVDVTGVQLVLQPPMTVPGRLVTTSTTRPPSLAGHRFQLAPLSVALRGPGGPQMAPSTATGQFQITNLMPGRFVFTGTPFFGASGDSVVWGVETVSIDGADITDRAFDIAAETPPKEVVVTLTDRWQEIAGRVTNSEGDGVSDYTMLAFPVDEAYWLHNSRRIVTTQPAGDGRYQLGGPGPALLPAGEYFLAAVTDVSKDEQYDPAFLKALIPAAIKITLGMGERKTQDVRVQ
jgi:hypothetical protein